MGNRKKISEEYPELKIWECRDYNDPRLKKMVWNASSLDDPNKDEKDTLLLREIFSD